MTRTVSESYDNGLAAISSGVFQFNAIVVVLNIHMKHLFKDTFIQHLLRSAGVDFLTGVDSNDPVTVMTCISRSHSPAAPMTAARSGLLQSKRQENNDGR